MATEVKLPQGWLRKDVQRASERLDRWSSHSMAKESSGSDIGKSTAKTGSVVGGRGDERTKNRGSAA